ncbi:Magnesium chelatase [Desulfatibacillum aliphaticivorans]|uniref:Mg-protoporphyrin IX chelatase n=1 Tax=Desulfatibacillum aliphaticivorans TaxID=218208 RepID=B8FC16_DESAL|nr:ATP-binding protein [Desulfatibacillum aliphaticivorans]ACL05221.1 Magnesium chelatase [Desulfatibacillum aliphaticivorans]
MKRKTVFPFAAIVGQDMMKLALILNVINPTLSGVLIRGEKGTGKSTAVRALADILPEIDVISDCPFELSPQDEQDAYEECMTALTGEAPKSGDLESYKRKVRVVELPVGATEDRVVGTLDLEHALRKGTKRVEPGLLAAAHRGILYVDEVNLLDDHIVDVLLDSAAMGVNTIEREGVSFSHPAKFTLVGTMNPEEGELRPQLLDRFGLCVHVTGVEDMESRVLIMKRRVAFDENPANFTAQFDQESANIAQSITKAREVYPKVKVPESMYAEIAKCCLEVGVDGHRADIIMLKTAKTLAAYDAREEVAPKDIETASQLVLPHRVRRVPLQDVVTDISAARGRK